MDNSYLQKLIDVGTDSLLSVGNNDQLAEHFDCNVNQLIGNGDGKSEILVSVNSNRGQLPQANSVPLSNCDEIRTSHNSRNI